MLNKRYGVTRLVILTTNYAIKIPYHKHVWRNFIAGLSGNLREIDTWRYNSGRYEMGYSYLLCPVVWASWGGWIVVMKRADTTNIRLDYRPWVAAGFGGDDKPENYGVLNGINVKIDYGSQP